MIKIKNFAITIGVCATVFSTAIFGSFMPINVVNTQAANKTEEVEIRLLATTDIHGQLNSIDYTQGIDYSNGGLARAYDLITQARNEKPDGNTLTFDVGDAIYDYTTEYIFSLDQKEIQPIFKAMAMVGYDAITMGNHEFDYGYDYMLNQYKGSGLMDKVVVSNVMDSKTGKHPFLENMLITREFVTKGGGKAELTIGIIGETIPNLTEKTQTYTGILKTEDIVENVKKQSIKLKEKGADIVVVLAHSGIGPVNPELNFKNVSYALSKIDEVDVIFCGHEHNSFPTEDKTSPYFLLPGVNKTNYLMNGKNVVMAADRGRAIGVVDLTIKVDGDDIEIVDRVSNLRYVNEYKTKENTLMKSLYGAWEDEFLKYTKEIIGDLNDGESINNYYGLFKDNTLIQLLNDAKKSHAIRFVNTEGQRYKDYPIIAVSTYNTFGLNTDTNYVNIEDRFTEADLGQMQLYNSYLIIYTINGKQLKEWLEWSASAYEVTTGNTKWTESTMSEIMKMTNLKSLIKEEWLNDFSSFHIFDGIDYEINPMLQPRYDFSGNKISNSTRVRNITYNGQPITDDMEFILASDKITKPTQANKGVEAQAVFKKFYRGQAVLSSYIKTISKAGDVLPIPDNNWRLQLDTNYKFIVNGPTIAKSIAEKSLWYDKLIKTVGNYNYYIGSNQVDKKDVIPPNLLLVPDKLEATGTGYNVAVNATDLYGIKVIKYLNGDYDLNYEGWNTAITLKGSSFPIKKNGIYSVYAEDNNGNKIVKKVCIDNISDKVVGKPKVETYTNRKTKIKGTAEPGVTIVFGASTGIYETVVSSSGDFSYSLPAQPSGSKVVIYAKDEETGRVSDKLTITVKRTGPNQPTLNHMYNNSEYIYGSINDEDAKVIAIVGNTVFVPSNGGKELYENAKDIYDPNMTIVKTDYVVNGDRYKLTIIPQAVNAEIKVYNIDHVYRVSRIVTETVLEGAPNVPELYEISNIEQTLTGNVTSSKKNTIFEVYAEVGGTTYQAKSDKYGDFSIEIDKQLQAGESIYVYATDVINGVTRKSAKAVIKVTNIDEYVNTDNTVITLDILNTKDTDIYGTYYDSKVNVYIVICYTTDGKITETNIYETKTDDFGDFSYTLPKALPVGTQVYAMTRFTDGDIISAAKTVVLPTLPVKPYLIEEISNSSKEVFVITDEDCLVTVKIGSNLYTSTKYVYDTNYKAYVYTVNVGRVDSGTAVSVYASNLAGTSAIRKSKIVKLAPNSPKVKAVYTDSTKITGTVEVFDVVLTKDADGSVITSELITKSKENAEDMSNVLSFVEQTDTKIYAKVGNKTYVGTIDEDGNFTIKIKKQKEGTVINVWATNKGGRGPQTKITVKLKK